MPLPVRRLYMDNAATSFPKPPQVTMEMSRYAHEVGASSGRGAYAQAMESTRILDQARKSICKLINATSAVHCVFTLNCTDALNLAIKGLIDPSKKQHVVCTAGDHNSILRPIFAMRDYGWLEVTVVPIDSHSGLVDPQDVKDAVRRDTKLIALTHVSNVTGTVQPLREIGKVAREMAVPLVVDAAQSIGHLDIDIDRDMIDLLAAPGHKALLGPLGTGFLYIRPGLEKTLRPLREGGTGSRSDEPVQPAMMPDKYEPGSVNAIGIAGLLAGVDYILGETLAKIQQHEASLVRTFIEGVIGVEGLTYLGPQGVSGRRGDRIGVFSVRIHDIPPLELAQRLEREFGILTRAGIHCAPFVHQTFDTVATGGATRLSFGPFLSRQDVKFAADALAQIAQSQIALKKPVATSPRP
jgi:cysteine desulfurase / selenocysteine lyase